MIFCPFCDHENMEGADHCEGCQHSLSELHLPTPATLVEKALLTDRVSVLEPKVPITANSDATLGEVLNRLVEKRIGSVLIVEDNKLVGIFSERDALMRVGANALAWKDRPISELMTPNPRALEGGAKVAFAVHSMDLGGYRHIPIVDGKGAAKGVISVRDILGFLSEKMAGVAS